MEPIFSVKTRSLPLKTAFEIAAFLQNALNATRLSFHSIMPGTVFGPYPKITKMDIARFAFKLFISGSRNATMISKTVQNDLLHFMGSLLLEPYYFLKKFGPARM